MIALLRLLPLSAQVGIGFALIAAVGASYWGWRSHIYNLGYAAAIEAVAAQDKDAIDATEKARARVRDCRNSGGVWDTARGVCDRR